MILVDTSVWVDHLRVPDAVLADLLEHGEVLSHPHVIGELLLGGLKRREPVLRELRRLPTAQLARDDEVATFILRHDLAAAGVGYVDAHLLAAARLTPGAVLWSRDRRLRRLAQAMGVDAALS